MRGPASVPGNDRGTACTNGNTRAQPNKSEYQDLSRSNAGRRWRQRWQRRRLRRRTAQAGREEPKWASGGNIRSGGAPEAVADLRAKAAAAAEAEPLPVHGSRHRGRHLLLPLEPHPLAVGASKQTGGAAAAELQGT